MLYEDALDNNCVVVCASGNDGSSHLLFPASMPEVLSVGAATSSGRRWALSQYGSTLDVVAPGNEVWTTTLGGTYISEPGTSMAAPHAAGIAALILSAKPGLSAKQVMDAIEQGAVELSTHPATQTKVNGPWNNEVGYGLVDAFAAVNTAMTFTPSIPPVAPPSTPSIYCDAYPVTDWNFVQDYGGSDMVFHTYPNRVVTFNIGSNYDSGTTFEWRTGGYLTPTSGTGNQFRVSSSRDYYRTTYSVACRAKKNGLYSDWTEKFLIVSSRDPNGYRAPIDSLGIVNGRQL